MLLASTGTATFASSVTIPNTFTSGTPAVAAEVNANFDALAVGVNDNDSRVTTNTSNISTNATGISTNQGNIATNSTNISSNDTDIAANAAAIATNATDIANLQSATSCPADMVAVGSLCVDQYEASIWDAASGGAQIAPNLGGFTDPTSAYPCNTDGSDCGKDAGATPIFARSVAGVLPAAQVSWYQATQACANVGKRLPTTAEWQMAASGTPAGGNGVPDCNSDSIIDTLANTGATTACVSSAGVNDMVGNIMEWAADIDIDTGITTGPTDMDSSLAWALGNSFRNNVGGLPTTTKAIFVLTNGPIAVNDQVGFRCVK